MKKCHCFDGRYYCKYCYPDETTYNIKKLLRVNNFVDLYPEKTFEVSQIFVNEKGEIIYD